MFSNVFTDFFSLLTPKPPITPEPSRKFVEARNEVGELVILDYLSERAPIKNQIDNHEQKR